MPDLPPFPTDDETLGLVQLAIDTPGVSVAGTFDMLGTTGDTSYHWCDVLGAFITEIRRLRAPDTEGAAP